MSSPLRFASLGSGSRGNSTLVEWSAGTLLIDCGFSVKQANERLQRLILQAAEKGIRIVPIGASGINKSTEYLMRALALGTNGTYTFLTDHSGIGNSHIKPSTDSYEVETLNALLVRILKSYTYMPDCQQQIPDLSLNIPDSIVTSVPARDSSDTNAVKPDPKALTITWSYYPNPTNGIIHILPNTDIKELYVSDLSGKVLQIIPKLKKDERIQVDLSGYTTGIYLIRYLDENFKEHTEEFDDIPARVIQHEYDHIEGILFTDRIHPLKRNMLKKKLNNISLGLVNAPYKMKFPKK